MTNTCRTIGRSLVVLALLFLVAAAASAEPIKYAFVNAVFSDGGSAIGYVVLDSPGDPLASPTVTDWGITVTGGNLSIPRYAYDPTSSTVEVLGGNPGAIVFHGLQTFPPTCGGVPRRLQIGVLSFDGASETCSVERSFATGSFQQVPGPLITVKANNQHTAARSIISGAFVRFSLDLSPAGSTADLDWYWAIVWENQVYWVTPAGTSPTPVSLGRGPAIPVNNKTLFFWTIGGTTVSAWIFAADGSNLVSVDHMTAVIPPSP
jgi:hypothetical protein